MDENQFDTSSGNESPYDDALPVNQVHDARRRVAQHSQGMGTERGQRCGKVHWKVMQRGEQHPAVDST
ncbi:hypothetical protein ACOB87_30380 [Streptomyces sp. YS-B37]|uniref:hypothetical protein n=1 Tax=Streptomyces sp. YS-B37 TaxID=3407669 RepID=UPI003B50BCF6